MYLWYYNFVSKQNSDSFYGLDSNWAMSAIESLGFEPTGEFFKLNSYENRVYDLYLEKESHEVGDRIIIKIYRPKRWSYDALLEEETFLKDLDKAGIPVIKNIELNGQGIFEYKGLYFTLYKRGIGRLPQELNLDQLKSVGRALAHIHNVGESKIAQHRKSLGSNDYGWPSLDVLQNWIAPEVADRYIQAAEAIIYKLEDELSSHDMIRIHGDCHRGNLIKNENGAPPFFFVDFDDFCMGPAVQDFWMLIPGSIDSNKRELNSLISGYEEFREFQDSQIQLIEPLRGLRIIHYAAWIARRWNDPTFPNLFPNFQDYIYWVEEVEALEKIAWNL